MFEKTTQEVVSAEAAIWAIPRNEWQIEQSDDGCPFYYAQRTSDAWQDGAIKLHEVELGATLPEGIPLLEKAVQTLKDAIAEERAASEKRVADLQQRIDTLALIEYVPEAT